jgi:SAM-dependent methyltransferase
MHASPDWYKTFFTGLAVEMWLQAMPEEMTQREVDFLRAKLQVRPPASLLDVPCGVGRHSLVLAAAGYHLTGVDLSPAFLQIARAQATERQLPIEWHEREMIDLPWPNAFDGAFCFGNSFGYLVDADNPRFLHAVGNALKPGARFVMDYPCALEGLLSTFQAGGTHQIGDILYQRNGHYDPAAGRIVVEHTFIRGSLTEKHVMSQRSFTYRELCQLLEAAGFVDLQGYGGLDEEPFTLGSKRLLLVATKKT